jgi:hypothetical protein
MELPSFFQDSFAEQFLMNIKFSSVSCGLSIKTGGSSNNTHISRHGSIGILKERRIFALSRLQQVILYTYRMLTSKTK